MTPADEYVLGRSDAETRRLILQHQIYGPSTRRFFQAAGIGPGMKVLDIGSGAGDVAMLAADLVGPTGQVVGVEMNGAIVETARARVASVGWTNVRFLVGDLREISLDSDFDAVVGRWILMHVPDPTSLVRTLVTRLRVGGVVAFQENDFYYPPTVFPPTELSRQFQEWAIPKEGSPGPEMHMGSKLLRTYVDAGLPTPAIVCEAPVGGGPDWPGFEYAAETLRSLLPAFERMGRALDPREVDIDTLGARMRDDATRVRGVQMLPMMFGAWSRKTG